jgi:S-adenosylmethionine:tRNA ribosyltransferase-isomerase
MIAGPGETELVINPSFERSIVDGILSGVHDPSQSHFQLLGAFADQSQLQRLCAHATAEGYLCHEFGDLCLIVIRDGRS